MKLNSLTYFLIPFVFFSGCSPTVPTLPVEHKTQPTNVETPTASPLLPSSTATPEPLATKIQNTPTIQSPTPLSTATASQTSTPEPPGQHTWEVGQILIQVETGGGDGCCYYTLPPELVLYGDGLLIRSKASERFNYEMMARKLDRQEICSLLNTIDQTGFLDYDHSIYMDPMDGAPSTFIMVDAWKKQVVFGQYLSRWIYEGGDWYLEECTSEECRPTPVILPALSNAFKLLDQYDPGKLVKLPAQQMVLWIIPEEKEDVTTNPQPWPIDEISLQELDQQADEDHSFMVIVKDQKTVQALVESVPSGYYVDGDVRRFIYIRPLWPAETHFGSYTLLPTAENVVEPGTTITCRLEDGTLPIP